MIECPICGSQLPDDAAFCSICGSALKASTAFQAQAPVQYAPQQQAQYQAQQQPQYQVPVQPQAAYQAPVNPSQPAQYQMPPAANPQQMPQPQYAAPAYAPQQASPAPAPQPAPTAPAKRKKTPLIIGIVAGMLVVAGIAAFLLFGGGLFGGNTVEVLKNRTEVDETLTSSGQVTESNETAASAEIDSKGNRVKLTLTGNDYAAGYYNYALDEHGYVEAVTGAQLEDDPNQVELMAFDNTLDNKNRIVSSEVTLGNYDGQHPQATLSVTFSYFGDSDNISMMSVSGTTAPDCMWGSEAGGALEAIAPSFLQDQSIFVILFYNDSIDFVVTYSEEGIPQTATYFGTPATMHADRQKLEDIAGKSFVDNENGNTSRITYDKNGYVTEQISENPDTGVSGLVTSRNTLTYEYATVNSPSKAARIFGHLR